MKTLHLEEARRLFLHSQQLFNSEVQLSTTELIAHLGHVQIDTISVVERAHHHILWSRNQHYQTHELLKLQKDKKIFEYWSHAASYLPIDHYPYCLPKMQEYRRGKDHWWKSDKKIIQRVLARLKAEGPLKSSDFESIKKSTGWFDWKPEKRALEQLFMAGAVMVRERKGFQKVYDLPENVLPSHIPTTTPSDEAWAHFFIPHRLKAQGILSLQEIAYQRGARIKELVAKFLPKLQKDGLIEAVSIKDRKGVFYMLPDALDAMSLQDKNKKRFYLLSPFDNSVIQRKKLQELFGFDYQIECYTPANKKKFGYFCLPMLFGHEFVGRIDLKADRAKKELLVNGLFWQDNISVKKKVLLEKDFQQSLQSFACFNQCNKIVFSDRTINL